MTRTIYATLTAALAAGTGIPFLKAYIGYSNGSVIWSGACLRYRLTGQTLELEVPYMDDLGGVSASIWLERGLTIAGTNYTSTTGRFRILSQHYLPNGRQVVRG